jgi:hypothetical protein
MLAGVEVQYFTLVFHQALVAQVEEAVAVKMKMELLDLQILAEAAAEVHGKVILVAQEALE